MKLKHIVILVACCLLPQLISAQTTQPVPAPTDFEVYAVFTDTPPFIDGNLDDAIWNKVQPITKLIQVWPQDGAPATEDSEVRIAYDRNNLYFAFRFYDRNPELIRAKNLERGGRNNRDDHAYIGIDTYLDGRNAYLFEMNALGTQDDALITDETLSYQSFSWDAVFISETVIDDEGWTLEVAIPFRQLRFPEGEELEFGLMVSRMINRKNERVLWPAIGIDYGGSFGVLAAASQYGRLKGLKGINRGKNIEIKPYLISGAQEIRPDLQTEDTDIDYSYDFGGDLKYSISSNMTLDLTVNTDFAQVEADNVQLNLTRFNLFFPEKREFFLERAGLFEHGNVRSTQTFFSRNIGLNEQILTGARLTGQTGRYSIGLMNIETGGGMGDLFGVNSANNSVARLQANILPRATIGTIFTNVERPGGYNRALGFDTRYRFWSSSQFDAWFTNVWDSSNLLNDAAGNISLQLENDIYEGGASFTSVGKNYRPELGFVRRTDFRQYSGNLGYMPNVDFERVPSVRKLFFQTSFDLFEGQDGVLQTTEYTASVRAEFQNRQSFEVEYERQFERLINDFTLRPNAVIPADDYTFQTLSVEGRTDEARNVFGSFDFSTGQFYDGNRSDFGADFGFRQSKHFHIEGGVGHTIIRLPFENGDFEATTIRTSLLGAISRKLFARALIQYDNFSRNLQSNLRINWIHKPGSDLFLVFNTNYHITGNNEDLFDPRRDFILNSRAGIIKLTYLIMI